MDHRNNFDVLRLFAAFNVVLQHAAYLQVPWARPLPLLVAYTSGVPIFFIISGYLITGTFFRNDGDVGVYLRNRCLRIYPGLWLNLAIILALLIGFGALPIGSLLSPQFLRYWTVVLATGSDAVTSWLLSPYPFAWNDALPFLPTTALWTIELELGFYLIVPAILLPPIRRRRWASVAVMFAATIYSHYLATVTVTDDSTRVTNPLFYFWFFGIGAIFSLLWPRIDRLFRGKFMLWALLYAEMVVLIGDQNGIAFYRPPTLQSTALTILLACCVMSAAFTWTNLSKPLAGNDISYGIYLHHMPVVMLLHAFGWQGFSAAVLLIVTTAIAAIATWFAVEQPALRFKIHSVRRSPASNAGERPDVLDGAAYRAG
ncbi:MULTISPECIES: acyltransferase [unclassified Bradyrhizobium]|uniref:acyltransferase family protein n=1 Tax=unclassified Bradyrhizobium TaxID=2631580 RepID=UPI001BA9A094|nr:MULTISPECIES: acyltransferase [unclassified Bradyrhizobium]MBR1206790.1 acyltransferase [Bradyrhizobium sp. AUGA SZCCT0124]MBR1316784.1 acyltransferase [Bradyrhizobium sp. AUGA SZCCT0051]MBR1344844.1 acyltransferase [Bradyrhizobium sp. AUGA SZCCT0105]MBR1356360.1 acyltransferase [Bradyrhizobium sp. AUGA SZCCT0045]